jgi:hypothetical protein
MRRCLIVVALVLLAAPLFAQSDRAVLLTSDGTLYSIDTVSNEGAVDNASTRYLVLTAVTSRGITKTSVPATLSGGHNWQPALAYDDDSQTLFVLWLRSSNYLLATNELVFCSYQNGKWNAVSAVDDLPYHLRYNLKVGVTRTVELSDNTGIKQAPGLSVHVAWWNESASAEGARYAMLTVEKGNVTAVYVRPLEDMVDRAFLRIFPANANSRAIMRQPAVFESPNRDTIDILFGDTVTNTLHRLTLKPVSNYRVRIPVGIRETSYPLPESKLTADLNSVVNAVPTTVDRLAFYTNERGSLKYLIFQDGSWSSKVQAIALTEVTPGEAVAALRKLVNGD